jgi:hypothetical protein
MPPCSSDACKDGSCPTRTACHQPEPDPPRRPPRIRMFRPSFDVTGPYRARRLPFRVTRWLRNLIRHFPT